MDDHTFDFVVTIKGEDGRESRYSANSLTTYHGDYTGKHGSVPLLSFRCSGHLMVVPLSQVAKVDPPHMG